MKRFNKLPKTPQGIQAVKAAKKRRLKPKFNYHLDISQWGATKQIVNDLKHVAMSFDEPDKKYTGDEIDRLILTHKANKKYKDI